MSKKEDLTEYAQAELESLARELEVLYLRVKRIAVRLSQEREREKK